ncbi:MAG: hypothetical protein L6Q38_10215, partial [Nitrospira sp.]|nr:hypothetical protein [Nitrospira sp.]
SNSTNVKARDGWDASHGQERPEPGVRFVLRLTWLFSGTRPALSTLSAFISLEESQACPDPAGDNRASSLYRSETGGTLPRVAWAKASPSEPQDGKE